MSEPIKKQILSTAEGYDLWAPQYDHNGNPMVAIDELTFANYLSNVQPNETVLDLGCGTGRLSIQLDQAGAEVTGLDGSAGMLEQAKAKSPASIQYVQHDFATPLPLKNDSFDRVVSSLVLEHLADLELFFQEMARVAKPGAQMYVSAMHPAMLLRSKQAHFTDEASGTEIYPQGYPHLNSDFILAILKAGLTLSDMQELPGTPNLAQAFPKAKKYIGWPMLVVFELTKTVSP